MHTHSYREPSLFAGQRVVVVGASASGEDISREIARFAKKVRLFAPAFDLVLDLLGPHTEEGGNMHQGACSLGS